MKTYKHLFEQLVSYENLQCAILRASRRKQTRRDVKYVLANQTYYIRAIQYMLRRQLWHPRRHKAVEINDGICAKKRVIVKPDFIYEQIVHHALVQVLQPIFMRSMYALSCGSIPNRGGVYGKKHLAKWINHHQDKAKYVAKGDIRHFFQSVPMERVKEKLARKIKDKRFLWVLFAAIDNCHAELKSGEVVYMGLCIGFYTSQWLANWYLQDIDYFVKQKLRVRCYFRYVDDFVLLDNNKRKLHKAMRAIRQWLERQRLQLKGNWQVFKLARYGEQKRRGRGIDFMGFVFFKDKTILRRWIFYRACAKARNIKRKGKTNWYVAQQLLCYLGWFKHSDTWAAFRKYVEDLVDIAGLKRKVSAHQLKINKEARNLC